MAKMLHGWERERNMTTLLAFTADQAACLTGLSNRQLRYWAVTGFFKPSFMDERQRPYGRIYSFRDVVGLRTLAMLRREHNIPLQELRKVGSWLDQHYDAPWAELRFYVAGRRVFFSDPELGVRRHGSRPQQTVIPVEMEAVAAAAEADALKLRERSRDEIGAIVRHRYTSHNAPVLAGTRIRTEAIWNFHQAGYTTDEIMREYPRLTPTDIERALAFERQQRAA